MIIKTSYPFMKPPPSARLIRGHRLAQGFAAYWPFSEDGGLQVFDASGFGNTGTLFGDTSWVPGKFGSALSFAGGYVGVPDSDSIDLTKMTISFWAYHRQLWNYSGLVVKGLDGEENYEILTSANGTVQLPIKWTDETRDNNASSAGIAKINEWQHYALTYDGTNFKLYVNASVVFSYSPGKTPKTNIYELVIGSEQTSIGSFTRVFNGLIDHVLIYNRALNASEIASLYREPFCMFERKARTALMSGYEVVAPPVGMAGAMTTNTGYWGW